MVGLRLRHHKFFRRLNFALRPSWPAGCSVRARSRRRAAMSTQMVRRDDRFRFREADSVDLIAMPPGRCERATAGRYDGGLWRFRFGDEGSDAVVQSEPPMRPVCDVAFPLPTEFQRRGGLREDRATSSERSQRAPAGRDFYEDRQVAMARCLFSSALKAAIKPMIASVVLQQCSSCRSYFAPIELPSRNRFYFHSIVPKRLLRFRRRFPMSNSTFRLQCRRYFVAQIVSLHATPSAECATHDGKRS